MTRRPNWAAYGFLVAAAAFVLLPVLWALSTSFKNVAAAAAYPPRWIPDAPTLENYAYVISSPKLLSYSANTFLVAGATIAVALLIGVPAAYAAERGVFRGKEAGMSALWALNMLGGVAVLLPLYLLATKLHIYDTKFVLVVIYGAMTMPTVVWLLRGFVARVPAEIEKAALIDGCSRTGAFLRITLPLMKPGLVAAGIFVFISVWNDFLIAYGLTFRDENRLIQVGIYYFVTDTGVQWGRMMAAVIASALPVLILFAAFQRAFIQGLGSGAVNE